MGLYLLLSYRSCIFTSFLSLLIKQPGSVNPQLYFLSFCMKVLISELRVTTLLKQETLMSGLKPQRKQPNVLTYYQRNNRSLKTLRSQCGSLLAPRRHLYTWINHELKAKSYRFSPVALCFMSQPLCNLTRC